MALRESGASMPQEAHFRPHGYRWLSGPHAGHTPADKYLSLAGLVSCIRIRNRITEKRQTTSNEPTPTPNPNLRPSAGRSYAHQWSREVRFFRPDPFFFPTVGENRFWTAVLCKMVSFTDSSFPRKKKVWQYFRKHVSAYNKARILISRLIFDYNSWWQLPCHSFLPLCARARKAAHSLSLS